MVTPSVEDESEENTDASDKPNNLKVTKESIHSKAWWANSETETGRGFPTRSDEYKGFTINSEGAGAVWDPLLSELTCQSHLPG